jgi:predicted DNA-binding antitoxin AbrB/MazE fold protein
MNLIPAIYEHGVFRPTVPVQLPEGTRVNIPAPEGIAGRPENEAARQRFLEMIGSVDLGHSVGTDNEQIDRDLAREHGNQE